MSETNRSYGIDSVKDRYTPFSSCPPTVSAAVWAQLLRGVRPTNDGSQSSLTQPDISHLAPPIAPVDRSAMSMRTLLHDTQSNFEHFTVELENLFKSIGETKTEIRTVGNLYAKNNDSLISDIIDLVNRSQREVQKTIGEPSQGSSVEASFKDVNGALRNISQRLDSIQSFNETHSRALQTQMQTVQMLLESQNKIISAVTPLLPLLQAIPPHLETLQGSIATQITERSSWKNRGSASASLSPPVSRKRKRLSSTTLSQQSSDMYHKPNGHTSERLPEPAPEKRPRLSDGQTTPKPPFLEHLFHEERENIRPHLSNYSRPNGIYESGGRAPTLVYDMNTVIDHNAHKPAPGVGFTTPRRPFAEAPHSSHNLPPPMMRKPSLASNTGNGRPTSVQSDKSLRRLASAAPISSDRERMPPPNTPGPLVIHDRERSYRPTLSDILRAENQRDMYHQEMISNPTPRQSVGNSPANASHKKTASIFLSPLFFSSGPGNPGTKLPTPQQAMSSGNDSDRHHRQPSKLPSSTPKNTHHLLKPLTSLPFGQINHNPGPSMISHTSSVRAGGNGAPSSLKPGRQSIQQLEGRRFIPLVDSDDEIEDDSGE